MVTVRPHMGTANPSNKICGRTVEMHKGSGGHGNTMFIHLGLAVPAIVVSLEGGKINILVLVPETKESGGRAICNSQVAPSWEVANGYSIRIGSIGQDEESWAIFRNIVLDLKSYGLSTTTIGIENLPQLNKVKEIAVDYGQGYLLSPPLNFTEAFKLMNAPNQAVLNQSSLT